MSSASPDEMKASSFHHREGFSIQTHHHHIAHQRTMMASAASASAAGAGASAWVPENDDSDYEYEYDDSGEEEEGEDTRKRKAVRTENNGVFTRTQSSTKTLKTTGEDSTAEFDASTCGFCQREAHMPVMECKMAALWMERGLPNCSGVLVIDASCVVAAMERRLDDCARQLSTYQQEEEEEEDAQTTTTGEAQNDPVDKYTVEAVMRRCRWNGVEWMDNYLRRPRNLTQRLQQAGIELASAGDEDGIDDGGNDGVSPARRYFLRSPRFLRMQTREAKLSSLLRREEKRERTLLAQIEEGVDPDLSLRTVANAMSLTDVDTNDSKLPAQKRWSRRPPQKQKYNMNWKCAICLDDEVALENRWSLPSCCHQFCRDCWHLAIGAMLHDARASGSFVQNSSQCPHPGCTEDITGGHIQEVAPEFMPEYEERVLDSFVSAHSTTMRWCPGPQCGRIAVRSRPRIFTEVPNNDANLLALCDHCETTFCIDCGDAPHVGRPCLEPGAAVEAMTTTVTSEAMAAAPPAGIVMPIEHGFVDESPVKGKLVRNCPSCGIHIEKTGGCNHMTCKCGHHFCWLCLADNKGGHFCGREAINIGRTRVLNQRIDLDYIRASLFERNPDEVTTSPETTVVVVSAAHQRRLDRESRQNETLTTTKTPAILHFLEQYQGLERFAHYYNRFLAHGHGQNFADNQCDCLDQCVADFTKTSDIKSGADTEFFYSANQLLVSSRRMLKYTYCYVYDKVPAKAFSTQTVEPQANNNNGGDGEVENGDDDSGTEDDIHNRHSVPSSNLPTQLALFLDHQERLERSTERLSFLMENALTKTDRYGVMNMMVIVKQCMGAVAASSFEEDCYFNYASKVGI